MLHPTHPLLLVFRLLYTNTTIKTICLQTEFYKHLRQLQSIKRIFLMQFFNF